MTNAFLTPDALSGDGQCKTITLPIHLWRYVHGALEQLGNEYRWEQHGAVTPFEASQYFLQVTSDFVANECVPPMTIKTCYLSRNTNQFISNATNTKISYTVRTFDADTFAWDNANQAIELLKDGVYHLQAHAYYASQAAGSYVLGIMNLAMSTYYSLAQSYTPIASSQGFAIGTIRTFPAGTKIVGTTVQNTGAQRQIGAATYHTALNISYYDEG